MSWKQFMSFLGARYRPDLTWPGRAEGAWRGVEWRGEAVCWLGGPRRLLLLLLVLRQSARATDGSSSQGARGTRRSLARRARVRCDYGSD